MKDPHNLDYLDLCLLGDFLSGSYINQDDNEVELSHKQKAELEKKVREDIVPRMEHSLPASIESISEKISNLQNQINELKGNPALPELLDSVEQTLKETEKSFLSASQIAHWLRQVYREIY